jgi:hypothetical protein
MQKRCQSSDVYLARYTPAKWIGTAEAVNFDAATAAPTKELEAAELKRVIAARRG